MTASFPRTWISKTSACGRSLVVQMMLFFNSFCFSVCPKPKRMVFDWDVCETGILQEKEKVQKNTLKTTTTTKNTFPVMGYPACMHWKRQVEKGQRTCLAAESLPSPGRGRVKEVVQSKWLPIKGPVSVFLWDLMFHHNASSQLCFNFVCF